MGVGGVTLAIMLPPSDFSVVHYSYTREAPCKNNDLHNNHLMT